MYVSPNGTGQGTIDNPTNLAAIVNDGLLYGDTAYLRAGTYIGNYTLNLNGTNTSNITVRNYAGERAIIDGQLTIEGNYTRVEGLEIAGSSYTDRSLTSTTGIILGTGQGHKIINCIIHDKYQGIGGGNNCISYDVYGCLIYHNGQDSSQGHGIYAQHSNTNGSASFVNNLVYDNFGFGFHVYGNSILANISMLRNTSFHNGSPRNNPERNMLLGGYGGVSNPVMSYNRFYHQMSVAWNMMLGWGVGNAVTNAVVSNNYSANAQTAAYLTDCITPTVEDNFFYGSTLKYVGSTQSDFSGDFPNNTYGAMGAWGDITFLESNIYDANRAHLSVYNKSQANTVTINVSSLFANGSTIKAYNVQDYFNDVQTLTVTNGDITINMQAENRTVASPVGWTAPSTTFPSFGCFVLIKQ